MFNAVDNNNVYAVMEYIRNGGDVNITNEGGNSLLIEALLPEYPNPAIVLSLINAGANVNAVDTHHENTPLHYALLMLPTGLDEVKDNIDIIKALFVNGADLYAKNNEGESPFDMAISFMVSARDHGGYSPYYSLFTDEIDRRKEEQRKLYELSVLRPHQNLALARGMRSGPISSLSGDMVESIAESLSNLNPRYYENMLYRHLYERPVNLSIPISYEFPTPLMDEAIRKLEEEEPANKRRRLEELSNIPEIALDGGRKKRKKRTKRKNI